LTRSWRSTESELGQFYFYMSNLAFQSVELNLPTDVVAAMREELMNGGPSSGTVLVGGVAAMPEVLYILWHRAGEVPVSITVRDPREDVTMARLAAREFLNKWREFAC
jgi:hypothetical protein